MILKELFYLLFRDYLQWDQLRNVLRSLLNRPLVVGPLIGMIAFNSMWLVSFDLSQVLNLIFPVIEWIGVCDVFIEVKMAKGFQDIHIEWETIPMSESESG